MGELVWDERLMSRERALELVGRWPLTVVVHPGEGPSVHLHCACPPHNDSRKACYQSVGRVLADYRVTLEELLAGVLRHAVQAHELDVGGKGRNVRRPGEGACAAGGGAGDGGGGRPGDRPFDQSGPPPGGESVAGGAA
jgi:hypothetical protein